METFYGGIDLHAKNAQACVIDGQGVRMKEKKLDNNLPQIFEFFEPFGKDIQIAIESTVNWYWIVRRADAQAHRALGAADRSHRELLESAVITDPHFNFLDSK